MTMTSRCILLTLTLLSYTLLWAQVPRTIAFQGSLTGVVDGNISVTFTLYDALLGGTALWTETKMITVKKGLFSTALGSATPILTTVAFDKQYFLGVKVGSEAEMTPRVALQSAPYALALPGVTIKDGNVGIGTTTPGAQLDVNGTITSMNIASGKITCDGVQTTIGSTLGIVPHDLFTYDTQPMANYGIGWFVDSWQPGGATAWLSGNNGIKLFTSGAPRLSISPGGNIGINTTSPSSQLDVNGTITSSSISSGLISCSGLKTDMGSVVGIVPNDKFAYDGQFMASYGLGWFVDSWKTGGATAWLSGYNGIKLFTAGSPRLIIDFPGNVSIPGPLTCQTLTLTSSRRFKDNVQPIRDPLTTIMKLQGVTYTWKPEQGGKPDMGFIAEEVAQVLPELVTMDKDGVHAKGMDYSHMVALTVEGIKAQQQQITTLKAENADLHAQMAVKDTLLQRLLIRLNSLDARVKRLEHGGVR